MGCQPRHALAASHHSISSQIIAPSREDILSNLAFFFGDPYAPLPPANRHSLDFSRCLPRLLLLSGRPRRSSATTRSTRPRRTTFRVRRLAHPPAARDRILNVGFPAPDRRVLRPEQPHPRHAGASSHKFQSRVQPRRANRCLTAAPSAALQNNLILRSPQEWQTSAALPFKK